MERQAVVDNGSADESSAVDDGGSAPRTVENDAYGAFVRRILRAYSRRIADGDVETLADLAALRDHIDQDMRRAVAGLRAEPWCYSWSEIARPLGITRQGAQQQYGG